MFPLFETIKIVEGAPKNLWWHQSRYEYSYQKMYANIPKYTIAELVAIPIQYSSGIVKLRFLYNSDSFSYEFSFYTRKEIRSVKLVESSDLDYSMKFTDRQSINNLLLKKGDCDDILIVKEKRITDCSFANVVLYNGNNWVTPIDPLLKGTCRERLLFEKRISEKEIMVNDLSHYSQFKLINAMLDFEDHEAMDISFIKK